LPPLVGGLAGVIFGILALAWPDVTILVTALLVGPVAVIYGGRHVLRALRDPKPKSERRPGESDLRRGIAWHPDLSCGTPDVWMPRS
jgi:hypothetical protein